MKSLKKEELPESPPRDRVLTGLTAAATKRHAEDWLKHQIGRAHV